MKYFACILALALVSTVNAVSTHSLYLTNSRLTQMILLILLLSLPEKCILTGTFIMASF